DESSNDDDDVDDVEKDEEDKEEEENLAPADPFDVPIDDLANTSNIQKGTGASQKATCYEYGNQRHYRRDCSERKNQNHENQIKGTKARGVVHASGEGETEQDLNNIEDEIEA
nr:hypothetical protein [Tanacetum cinerariifolium]